MANNSVSSVFTAVPTAAGASISSDVHYGAQLGGTNYVCRFSPANVVKFAGGSCGTPSVIASSVSGKYPSPHCSASVGPVDPNTCNYSVSFSIAQ